MIRARSGMHPRDPLTPPPPPLQQVKLRVMMRMMGLGTSAYWVINYVFWFLLYALFAIIFVFVGSVVSLPSGYKLGLFTRQDYRCRRRPMARPR